MPGAGRRKTAGALVPTKPADLPPLTPDQLNDQDGEPRVLDLALAERLGFSDVHKVRALIERNRSELESYGVISAAVAENTDPKGRGRPGKAYYLNEGQALVICALSRTPQAALVRRQIIEVFLAYRRGVLPVAEEQQQTIAHLAAELADLRQRVALIGAAPHIRAIFKGGYLPGSTALTVQDISMEWDEPRISDQRLAVQLGLPDMHTVRKLIRSHRNLLAGLGRIVSVPQVKETDGKGRPLGAFWLTELQALAVCGLVSGNVASATRTRLIKVFAEFRRGQEELAAAGGIREVRNNAEMVVMLDERVAALEANARTESRTEVRRQRRRVADEALTEDGDLLYGGPRIAAYLGVRLKSVEHMIRSDKLPHFRMSGRVCSRKTLLGAWLDGKEVVNA
ncbi:hypothetical protein D2T81_02705 [Azospirillum brasilense]|nr:hypothetical protein D2T81_02705 [Azospirillum brasilense]